MDDRNYRSIEDYVRHVTNPRQSQFTDEKVVDYNFFYKSQTRCVPDLPHLLLSGRPSDFQAFSHWQSRVVCLVAEYSHTIDIDIGTN